METERCRGADPSCVMMTAVLTHALTGVPEAKVLAGVTLALRQHVSPNFRTPDGLTPLMVAAWAGMATVVETLCTEGADVNLRSPFQREDGTGGYTALHYAVVANSSHCVEVLLAHGADPSAPRDDPNHPLTPMDVYHRPGPLRAPAIGRLLTEAGAVRSAHRWPGE
jgi:hypothetical protein